jgi:hypothetical protein
MTPDELSFNDLDNLVEPIDKETNKATMVEKLQGSFANGVPFIDYCDGYVYLVYPDGDEWTEYSFTREDGNLAKVKRDAETTFHIVKEEVIRGLGEVVPDAFNTNDINAMAEAAGNDPRQLIDAMIAQLDPAVPIVRSEAELGKAIDMVQSA